MNDAMSWLWLGLAGVLVILEISTGTFYLLMVAFGMLAGALAAWFGSSLPTQMLWVAVVGIVGVLLLRLYRRKAIVHRDPSSNPGINLDIGQRVRVERWNDDNGLFTARAAYRGAEWDVELQGGAAAGPGWYVIRAVQGSRLIVAPEAAGEQQALAQNR